MNTHLVQFCSDDAAVLDSAVEFVEAGQRAGEPVLVVLAGERLRQLLPRVQGDLPVADGESRQFLGAGAEQALARILVEGVPDEDRFNSVIRDLVAQVRGASQRPVRVLTELAALLCSADNAAAVPLLEQFWTRLAEEQTLQLHCLYPIYRLAAASQPELVDAVCAAHTQVVPCGLPVTSATDAQSLLRTIAELQRHIASLDAELATYRRAGEVAEKARHDMAALAQAYSELERIANLDPLTGLYNRRVFLDRLEHALERAKRRRNSFALLLVDLDDFKSVNDRLGHEAGDLLLREVAARLGHCARGSDTVCRLGGDEFTVIMEDCSAVEAALVAQRIVDSLDQEMTIEGESIQPGASVGVSVYPHHADDAAALIRSADKAMYRAKGQGKGRYEDSGLTPLT